MDAEKVKFLVQAEVAIASMNDLNATYRQQLLDADVDIAERQKKIADQQVELRQVGTSRQLVAAKRAQNKARYDDLHERAGAARKALNTEVAAEIAGALAKRAKEVGRKLEKAEEAAIARDINDAANRELEKARQELRDNASPG